MGRFGTRALWILGVVAAVAGLAGLVLAERGRDDSFEPAARYRGAAAVSAAARPDVWALRGEARTLRCAPRCRTAGRVRVQVAIRYRGRRPVVSATVARLSGGGVKARVRVTCRTIPKRLEPCAPVFFRGATGYQAVAGPSVAVRAAPLPRPTVPRYRWAVEVSGVTTTNRAQFVEVTWADRTTPAVTCARRACRFAAR